MKLLMFLFVFFVLGALLIISNNNLALYRDENVRIFTSMYVDWLDNIYGNVQTITGNLVKLDWLPDK